MTDKQKTITELLEITKYRVWLQKMGLYETYEILLEGSTTEYG